MITSSSYKSLTSVSGILIFSRNFSGILTRNVSAFSGILEQTFGFSGPVDMGLSGILEFCRKISGSGSLTASSGPNKFGFRVDWTFYFGYLDFYPKIVG